MDNDSMFEALKRHDFSLAKKIIDEGYEITFGNLSLLEFAIQRHDDEIMEFILAHGGEEEKLTDKIYENISWFDGCDLEFAIKYGFDPTKHYLMFKELLSVIDGVTDIDKFANRMALYHRLGFDFNDRKCDLTPLNRAILSNVPSPYLGVLLEHGAIPDLIDAKYTEDSPLICPIFTPLHEAQNLDHACDKRAYEYIKIMAEKSVFCPDVFKWEGGTPLSELSLWSPPYGEANAHTLLNLGATAPESGSLKRSPENTLFLRPFNVLQHWPLPPRKPIPFSRKTDKLVSAVAQDNWNQVRQLLDQKIPLNASGQSGVPLYVAMLKGNEPMVRRLIEAGADPNLAPEQLIHFAPVQMPAMVDFLSGHGADYSGRDEAGFTVLHKEVAYWKELIKRQPDVDLEPFRDKLKVYLRAGVNINDRWNMSFRPPVGGGWLPASEKRLELLGIMLDHGAVMDLPVNDETINPYLCKGHYLLHEIIANEQADPHEVVNLLRFIMARSPFNPDLIGRHGLPLLHVAVASGSVECVRYLLEEARAWVDMEDSQARTAAAYLMELYRRGDPVPQRESLEKLRMLLDREAPLREIFDSIRYREKCAVLTKDVLGAPVGTYPAEVVAIFKDYDKP